MTISSRTIRAIQDAFIHVNKQDPCHPLFTPRRNTRAFIYVCINSMRSYFISQDNGRFDFEPDPNYQPQLSRLITVILGFFSCVTTPDPFQLNVRPNLWFVVEWSLKISKTLQPKYCFKVSFCTVIKISFHGAGECFVVYLNKTKWRL